MSAQDPIAGPLPGDPGIPGAQRLAGKVAIVTGAGSRTAGPDGPVIGNGRATAIVLAWALSLAWMIWLVVVAWRMKDLEPRRLADEGGGRSDAIYTTPH